MSLNKILDGASRHLLVHNMNEGTKKLALILCLPLVDGVFATLLVTGAVETFSDIVSIALTIFTGAGALAVLYSYSSSKKEALTMVKQVVPVMFLAGILVALIAPVFESIFYLERMQLVAGLVLVVIALDILDHHVSDYLSVPTVLLTGMLLSLRNPSAITISSEYLAPALVTLSISIVFLYVFAHMNREMLDLDVIRKGGAAVLMIIAASMFGLNVPSGLSLTVLALTFLAALDSSSMDYGSVATVFGLFDAN